MKAQAAVFIKAFLFALLGKICKDHADFFERRYFLVHMPNLLVGDVPAKPGGRIFTLLQIQQLSNFSNRKTGLLGPENKLQSFEVLGNIEPIAVCCPTLWVEETHLLVIAERFTGQAGGLDDTVDC